MEQVPIDGCVNKGIRSARASGLGGVVLVMLAMLVGCSEPPEQILARAQERMNARDYRSAVIDLKALLQQVPDNAQARWLLGNAYLEIEDGASASKELSRARVLGVAEDSVLPLLARALLLENRPDDVLEMQPIGSLTLRSQAEFSASLGLAHLIKGDTEAARARIAAAFAGAPQSVPVRLAMARLLRGERKFEEAETVLRGLLDENPRLGVAWSLLGDVYAAVKDYPEAEAAYGKAMSLRYIGVEDQLRRASARVAQGNLDGAAADAQDLLRQAPDAVMVQYFSGLVHYRQGRYEEAAEAFERVYAKQEQHLPTKFLLASTELRRGNMVRAQALAESVVLSSPTFVPGRKLLASIYLEQARWRDAEELLQPIAKARPDDLDAKDALASSLLRQGKAAAAADLLEEIAARREDRAEAQARAGLALLSAGREQDGFEALRRASDLAPEEPLLHATVVTGLLQRDRKTEAVAAAEEYVAKRSTDAAAWSLLGGAQRAAGEAQAAQESFEKALALAPGDPVASIGLAQLAIERKDIAAARTVLEASRRLNPNDGNLLYRLAEIARHEERPDQARSLLQEAIHVAPNLAEPRVAMARILVEQNDASAALEQLAGVSADAVPAALLVRGQAYMQMQRLGDARRALEELRARTPDSPQVHYALAVVYAELGELRALRRALDQVLELAPQSPQGLQAKARFLAINGRSAEAQGVLAGLPPSLDDPATLATRHFVARHGDDVALALATARQWFDRQPATVSVVALAAAQSAAGAPQDAVAQLENWLSAHPRDVQALQVLSGLYAKAGKGDAALALQERVLEAEPDNVIALNNLAWHYRLEAPGRALELAERARDLAPDAVAVLDTYAEVLARNGKTDLALIMIDRAVERAGGNASLRLRRAEILWLLGKPELAESEVEAVAAESPPAAVRERAAALLKQWRDG